MTDLAKVRALAVQIVAEIDAVPAPDPVPVPDPTPAPDPVPTPDPVPVPAPTPDPVPAPVPAPFPANVANRAELLAAIAPGAKLYLAPGDYGALTITGKTGLSIASADPANPARFATLAATGCSGLALADLYAKGTQPGGIGATISLIKCSASSITDCHVEAAAVDGVAGGYPIYVLSSQNIAITRVTTRGGLRGMQIADSDGVTALDADCADFRAVAIGGGGNNDLTIDGLQSRNAISKSWPNGDHGDHIHLWTDKARGPSKNIAIRNSTMMDASGNPIMGISIQTTGGHYFDGVVLENNLIVGANSQAMRLENIRNGRIARNALVPTVPFAANPPRGEAKCLLVGGQNIAVDGNIFGNLPNATPATVGTNLKITVADLARVFANPTGSNRDDFFALASGPGAGLGIK